MAALLLKDNSEVGEAVLVRCSTNAFYLPAKEADPQLAMGPSGRGIGDSPYLLSRGRVVQCQEGTIAKGPRLVLGYLFMVSQTNLSALEQS